MRYAIIFIIMFVICSCGLNDNKKNIEVVFTPGLAELNLVDTIIIKSINHADKIYPISLSDYSLLIDILSCPNRETTKNVQSPCVLIMVGTVTYTLGENNVVQVNNKFYSISEREAYKIKCITHFYDFIEKADLYEMNEIKKFGMPDNYSYCPSDPNRPTKLFIKVMLEVI